MFKGQNLKAVLSLLVVVFLLAFLGSTVLSGESADKKGQSKEGCVDNAAGPLTDAPQLNPSVAFAASGYAAPTATVGKKAPDFEATAYQDGGFKKVKLSDYAGKWVVLCFYPGDFTFV